MQIEELTAELTITDKDGNTVLHAKITDICRAAMASHTREVIDEATQKVTRELTGRTELTIVGHWTRE